MFNAALFLSIALLGNQLGPVPSLGGREPLNDTNSNFELTLAGIKDYQIGTEWGKKLVTTDSMSTGSHVYRRTVSATAYFGSATSFYLGKFDGKHIMATNHHVLPNVNSCKGRSVKFTVLNFTTSCKQAFGSWTEIDLALFEIEPTSEQAKLLEGIGQNFAFHDTLNQGTELITAGYGVAGNFGQKLVANEDSDCKVFSKANEFKFMADPDELNPGPYRAWSFSTGCDVSHGDSGSAMVDRITGKVVGLIWTGRIPKNDIVQNSENLNNILINNGPEIWTELSYAVPAQAIYKLLSEKLQAQESSPEFKGLLSQLLGE